MTVPAEQTSVRADAIGPGDWVFHEGRWVAVADVATADGRTVVTLAPLTYAADEHVAVCAPLAVADHGSRKVR